MFHSGQKKALNDVVIQLVDILNFYHKGFLDLDYKVRELKSDLLHIIINLSRRTSPEFHRRIIEVVTNDWTQFFKYWKVDEIREIINITSEDAEYLTWGLEQLSFLEARMLEGKYVGERSEQCIKQVRSWLRLGKSDRAEENLKKGFTQTIGVRGEKDYQLDSLIKWLPRINQLEQDRIEERLSWYLKRLDFIETTTSHAHSFPALKLLRTCLEWNPGNGFGLFKWLLVSKLVKFPDSLEEVFEFLVEKDSDNTVLYSKLFTRVLLFFQDNGKYGYHVVPSLIRGLKGISLIKNFVSEIRIYGIEEKKNEVVRQIIEACENNGINIGILKEHYPIEDRYTSTESYTSLRLKSEEEITNKEAVANIHTIEQALDLINKESENSHFDWTDVISSLKMKLTEQDFRSFTKLKTFDSVKLAKVGTVAYEMGFTSFAREMGYEALNKSRNAGWLTHYDGGSKLKSYQLLTQVEDRGKVGDLAFKDLAFSLKEIDDKRLFEDVFPILEIISPNVNYADLYKEVEIYLEELFRNATLNEKVFDFQDQPIAITELCGRLMTFLYEFPVSNMKEHLETIAIESYQESQIIIEHFLDGLYSQSHFEGYLVVLYGIFYSSGDIEEKHVDRITPLLKSERFDVMHLAYGLLGLLGRNSELDPEHIQLPLTYEMSFKQKPELIIDEETRIKQIEKRRMLRETNDPLEYIMIFKNDATFISKSSGIPLINIAYRMMQMAEQEVLPEWYHSLSEEQISNLFKSIDMNMPYIRPRMLRLWPALTKVTAELWRSKYLSYSAGSLICRQVDAGLYSITISQRKEEIQNLTDPSNDSGRRKGANEKWVNEMDESCFDRFLKTTDNKIILAELSLLKSLDDGRATEIRQSFISSEESCNKKRFYFFEGGVYNSYLHEYLNCGEDELILFNYCQTFDTRKHWLAINPQICIRVGWTLATEGNFRWVDPSDNIMVESIYWLDGNYQNYERLLYSETGYGWYVLASEAALEIIKGIADGKIFLHQKCIREFRLYQKKYGTDIEARKELFSSQVYMEKKGKIRKPRIEITSLKCKEFSSKIKTFVSCNYICSDR